jgi:hypothetical protein
LLEVPRISKVPNLKNQEGRNFSKSIFSEAWESFRVARIVRELLKSFFELLLCFWFWTVKTVDGGAFLPESGTFGANNP